MPFLDAALVMLGRGWLCHPLRNDANGLPKVPITVGGASPENTEDVIRSLDWDKATGLGIVLGAVSSNLAVLDLDDEELFNITVAMQGFSECYRMVRTAR